MKWGAALFSSVKLFSRKYYFKPDPGSWKEPSPSGLRIFPGQRPALLNRRKHFSTDRNQALGIWSIVCSIYGTVHNKAAGQAEHPLKSTWEVCQFLLGVGKVTFVLTQILSPDSELLGCSLWALWFLFFLLSSTVHLTHFLIMDVSSSLVL